MKRNIMTICIVASICLILAFFIEKWNAEDVLIADGDIKVHFIDVGQGDSILIQTGAENILIDAGTKGQGDTVIAYLEKWRVQQLDAVISTHPDADHVGGLAPVINHFPVKTVYAPKITHTTDAYKDFLTAVKRQQLKMKVAKLGVEVPSSIKGLKMQFIGPTTTYSTSDLNNWSAVLQLTHGSNEFLFTGDAENRAEKDMLQADVLSEVDVLKVSHHGAKEASTANFLRQVRPKYAVISVGNENRYGHPTKETLKRLQKEKTTILRTDQSGTITITSTGTNLSMKEES